MSLSHLEFMQADTQDVERRASGTCYKCGADKATGLVECWACYKQAQQTDARAFTYNADAYAGNYPIR